MINNKIIVFSDFDSLHSVVKNKRNEKGIPLIQDNSVLGFDESLGCFVTSFNDKSLILVQDSVNSYNEDFVHLLHLVRGKDVMILKHRLPAEATLELFKNP